MDPKHSPHGIKSEAYTAVRMGVQGAVVANHPLAAQAGMRVLQQGGNAVDAAIAVAFALGVAEPAGSTIGGDGFMMVYMKNSALVRSGNGRAGNRKASGKKPLIEVANGTGAAPLAATPEFYREGIPSYGVLSVSVPGILAALLSAHERFGTLPLLTCIEPAIELCEAGVPVTYYSHELAAPHPVLNTFPESARIFAKEGKTLLPGAVRRNPDLARTYRTIAEQGRGVFYEGEIGEEIVRSCKAHGGILSMKDLRRHKVVWQDAISVNYRGRTVYEAPPNSSGHALLQMLSTLETFDIPALGHNTADSIHLLVEAKRLAFADREAYLADPDFVDVPIEGLLSPEYNRDRARLISRRKALSQVTEGDPWAYMSRSPDESKKYHRPSKGAPRKERVGSKKSDTTHFCIVDRWGNAVGELQSIQMAYGSGVVAGNTGILLNNRMTYWHVDPDHIDHLTPGQRVRHTMNPVMTFDGRAEDGGRLAMVHGTPGADTQVQSNLQVLSAVFDHGYNVSEALHAARWTHYQGRTGSAYPHVERNALEMERRLPEALLEDLRSRGHQVQGIDPWKGPGSEGAIQVHPESGALMAAADPRRDGAALVW